MLSDAQRLPSWNHGRHLLSLPVPLSGLREAPCGVHLPLISVFFFFRFNHFCEASL